MRIIIRARTKSLCFIKETITIDENEYRTDRNSLLGIASDFLDDKYGDIIKYHDIEVLNEDNFKRNASEADEV